MTPLSGLGRDPSRELTGEALLEIVGALDAAGVMVWLDGGWAVDAALGGETRGHDDLDLVVELGCFERMRATLGEQGFSVAAGEPPESVEFVDDEGRQVDVHPVRLTRNGDGRYRMQSGDDWVYPAAGFDWEGSVQGVRVRCLSPDVQMLCHSGFEPHRTSYDDVWALSRRFGLDVPDGYGRPRETYPVRR